MTETPVALRRAMASWVILTTMLIVAGVAPIVRAADEDETELAKKTQNPVADLISVPLQNNFNFNTGEKDATVWILNVQPVVPIKLTEDWNVITRTIVPIINQPSLFEGPNRISGRLFKLGKLPINTSLQAYYNAVKPDFGSDWPLRFQVQFLLPTVQKKPLF